MDKVYKPRPESWDRFIKKIERAEVERRQETAFWGAAAVVLLMIGSFYSLRPQEHEVAEVFQVQNSPAAGELIATEGQSVKIEENSSRVRFYWIVQN